MRRYRTKTRFYVIVMMTMLCVFGVSFSVAWNRLRAERTALSETIARYDQQVERISELNDELAYVKTDEYIERAARDELGMLFAGEYRYVGQ